MKTVVILFFILFLIVVSSCASKIDINIEDVNNCDSDSDCVIVEGGFCGGAAAINKNYVDGWERHIQKEIREHIDAVCKETLPLDFFGARCIEGKCEAIQIVE